MIIRKCDFCRKEIPEGETMFSIELPYYSSETTKFTYSLYGAKAPTQNNQLCDECYHELCTAIFKLTTQLSEATRV